MKFTMNKLDLRMVGIFCVAISLVTGSINLLAVSQEPATEPVTNPATNPATEPSKASATRGSSAKPDPQRVLARVGEKLITQGDVDLTLGRTASGRTDLPPVPEPLLMSSVEIIAQRSQALENLKRNGKMVSDKVIDKWLVENSPPDSKLSAAQALSARAEAAQVQTASYRELLAFRLSWQEYLQTALTEKNIEKHFSNQKARFDGTRFEIEHLWIPTPPGKSAARTEAHKKLVELRLKLLADQMTMAEAGQSLASADADEAAKAAAAKEVGPRWITGSGPLIPRIVDEVIKTPAGKLSEPFDSATAVHIVKVNKIEPGSRPLSQAHDDVRKHMLLYLLEFHAGKTAAEMPLVWLAK